MKKLLIAIAVLAFAATANAQWFEDFDGYANGQTLNGTPDDGGWRAWVDNPTKGAPVTDAYSLSGAHSVQIGGPAHILHGLDVRGGAFSFSLWQYIPSTGRHGTPEFGLLNVYGNGIYNWSTLLRFDLLYGVLNEAFVPGDENVPLVFDRWAEIRVDIDLENDAQTVYYDGSLVSTNTWLMGDPSAQLALEGVQLYGGIVASNVYYDSIVLIPEPGTFLLVGAGVLTLIRGKK